MVAVCRPGLCQTWSAVPVHLPHDRPPWTERWATQLLRDRLHPSARRRPPAARRPDRAVLGQSQRAPRGATDPGGDARAPPPVCRSRPD